MRVFLLEISLKELRVKRVLNAHFATVWNEQHNSGNVVVLVSSLRKSSS